MKYTSLFSAVALAAAMGTQAFGDPALVKSDDFEGYVEGPVTNTTNTTQWNTKGWSFVGDENDCQIVTDGLTGTNPNNQSLKLNTNGGLAQFAAQTTKDYAATVTMRVRMVASDSPVDMSTDSTTQAALYLQSTEENGVTTYELKAFSSDSTQGAPVNVWVPLTATGFEIDHDNYDANVSIVIDYNEGTATYTVNDTTFDPVDLANPTAWSETKCLNSVAFKGTGFVDDLFVGHERIGTYATFAYETILNGVTNVVDSGSSQNLDNALWAYSDIAEAVTGYEYTLKLYSRENNVDTDLNATITADATTGEWTVNASTYTSFAGGGTYVVKAEYTKLQLAVTVNYYAGADTSSELLDTVNDTVPYGDTYAVDISEYPNVTDSDIECNGETYDDAVPITAAITINVFNCSTGSEQPTNWTAATTIGTLTFTAYDPAAGTASFTWTAAAGYNFVAGDTRTTLGVLTATTADGVPAVDATATVTLDETTSPLTGEVSGLPKTGNSLFLFGVGDKAAQQAGE